MNLLHFLVLFFPNKKLKSVEYKVVQIKDKGIKL